MRKRKSADQIMSASVTRMKSVFLKIFLNYGKLIVIWFLISLGILVLSYKDISGMLSHDSTAYLRLALNLNEGHGYFIGHMLGGSDGEYFTLWPIGYGTAIAFFSNLLPSDVYLASKIVNIFFVAVALGFLNCIFGPKAYIYGTVFLTSQILVIMSMTLSEVPLLTGMIVLSVSLFQVYKNGKNRWIILMFITSVMLFLSRWPGIFALIPIFILSIFFLGKKNYRIFLKLSVANLGLLFFCISYLYIIKEITGNIGPGVEGLIGSKMALMATVFQLLKAMTEGVNLITSYRGNGNLGYFVQLVTMFISTLLVFYLILISLRCNKKTSEHDPNKNIWIFFLMVGLSYLVCIIGFILIFGTPEFNLVRWLFPGTPLLIISFFSYCQHNTVCFDKLKKYWLIIPFSSFVLNVVILPIYSVFIIGQTTYPEHVDLLEKRYSIIRSGSVLISDDDYVRYVRPDIYFVRLYNKNLLNETVAQSCDSLKREIYVGWKESLPDLKYNHEFVESSSQNSIYKVQLLRIARCQQD